jgi:pimeloyl-ACP methyl ester carboxylesterase
MQPREREILYLLDGAFHRLAFTAWGDVRNQPVVCVHGLTRNSRDFDTLAAALAERFYVLCPDLPGRGRSGWLPDAAAYHPLTYVHALSHLLAFINDRPVHWIGTSLGGICGMLLASAPGNPIQRLVLNDVGPFIPQAAVARIADYLSTVPDFADLAELERYLRAAHAPFGTLSDAQWARMAETSARTREDGRVGLHYDPGVAAAFRASPPADVDMWPVWDRIAAKTLTLRGESSDLLLAETLARMAAKSATHVVANAGHAPALMDDATIDVITRFLEA